MNGLQPSTIRGCILIEILVAESNISKNRKPTFEEAKIHCLELKKIVEAKKEQITNNINSDTER